MTTDKPLPITKVMVWKAYQQVKRNGQAAGVDGQSLDDFNKDLENNLYKLWNRMASGSYLPPPVRRVEIPKSGGGVRPLGIPTVADRIAQMVVKQVLEPELELIFDQEYPFRGRDAAAQHSPPLIADHQATTDTTIDDGRLRDSATAMASHRRDDGRSRPAPGTARYHGPVAAGWW
ncbi:hypothetical protein [Synechococcus sp. CBW1006]|uniref:hypothetical protein n=1 Tax=Synechococcus sp. CBW1006 TaxID=1353138 RepID=UPI0018CF0815|nr:hypothetical protein [Synechococcus sp. CBW1006]